jgi:acetyl-CoA carboxylase alpha subunit
LREERERGRETKENIEKNKTKMQKEKYRKAEKNI